MEPPKNSKPNSDGAKLDPDDSLTDEEWEKQMLATDEQLKELGLDTRDDLILSIGPSQAPGKPATK